MTKNRIKIVTIRVLHLQELKTKQLKKNYHSLHAIIVKFNNEPVEIGFLMSSTTQQSGQLIIIEVSAIHRESMKGYPACLSIVRFSYLPTFQTEIFC